MHQILTFITFLFRSTNQHGVHSPFVYDLLTQCIYKKEKKEGFKVIEAYRKAILKDHRIIQVKDFGAGSRVFKSDERKISAIAKNAGISKKRAFLLNKLTSYLNIRSALELGTSLGISSAAIAAGNKVQLTTLEGCPETAAIAKEYFERFGLKNIKLKVGKFNFEHLQLTTKNQLQTTKKFPPRPADTPPVEEIVESGEWRVKSHDLEKSATSYPANSCPAKGMDWRATLENQQPTTNNKQPSTDLIFFDGNHQKEATLKYFHQLLPLAHNNSVFIFDDIHWSKGMEEAWEEIKEHPEVRVSIDSFYWGIVFFRKEQKKEHFVIRM